MDKVIDISLLIAIMGGMGWLYHRQFKSYQKDKDQDNMIEENKREIEIQRNMMTLHMQAIQGKLDHLEKTVEKMVNRMDVFFSKEIDYLKNLAEKK